MATRSRTVATATGERPAPRLRRAYYDCRFGQLHVHNAIPAGGGFDELTPLVCIHGATRSGHVFRPLLAALGADRSIYAPDLPGCGESDPAPDGEPVEAGAQAIGDFLESMRIRTVDLVAVGEGCAVSRRLALLRPTGIRRLVLAGEPGAAASPSSHPVLLPGTVDLADPAVIAKFRAFLA